MIALFESNFGAIELEFLNTPIYDWMLLNILCNKIVVKRVVELLDKFVK
jgi:hypothetical protein